MSGKAKTTVDRLSSNESQHEERLKFRRRRLLFRCWHRGTQESDLLLGSFADVSLARLEDEQLERFEALLDCTDPDLFDWIIVGTLPPPEHNHDLMRHLRDFCTRRHRTSKQSA